jgi:hypothetical protein
LQNDFFSSSSSSSTILAFLIIAVLPANGQSCEICPGGSTISNPAKELLLVPSMGIQTCQELLTTTTSLDSAACSYLQPFYGAICGCPTTPLYSGCDLCSSTSTGVGPFHNPTAALDIPGSTQNVEITCGAIYEGAKLGAVTPNDCSTLAQLAGFCGGCGAEATTGPPTETPTVATTSPPTVEQLASGATVAQAVPSPAPTSITSNSPTIQQMVASAVSYKCDLCPPDADGTPGIIAYPSKVINLDGTTTTCGAMLWNSRTGAEEHDDAACEFLSPFHAAICGCSTFKMPSSGGCNLCTKDSTHSFLDSGLPLVIPGSNTSSITCGSLQDGALNGAVSADDCGILSGIADICGGCGVASGAVAEGAEPEGPTSAPTVEEEKACLHYSL